MENFHKQTISYVTPDDFYQRGQSSLQEFIKSDLSTSEKKRDWELASIVILTLEGSRYILKSRY